MSDDIRSRSRRRVLALVCGTGLAPTAGCLGSLGSGGSGDGGSGDSGSGDGATTETTATTPEPTATTTDADASTAATEATTVATTTTTETTTTGSGGEDADLGDPAGSVATTPDGLAVVKLESYVGSGDSLVVPEGRWATDVTVENVGDRETELVAVLKYRYGVTAYDDAGEELHSGEVRTAAVGDDTIGPGETHVVSLALPESVDPESVARYEVSITCEAGSDAAYCG